MAKSKIDWTDEGVNFYSWNCTKVSPGCLNCYAEARAKQFGLPSFSEPVRFREKAFEELQTVRAGNTVFINTHSDTYHETANIEWVKQIHKVIGQRPDLIFLLLTKRIQNVIKIQDELVWPDNLWLGVSVETPRYLHRIMALSQTPAQHRFVSFEPLLSAFDPDLLGKHLSLGVEWAIVGGESGEVRRGFNKAWAKSMRVVCQQMGVPFFFKQGSTPYAGGDNLLDGKIVREYPAPIVALKQHHQPDVSQGTLF